METIKVGGNRLGENEPTRKRLGIVDQDDRDKLMSEEHALLNAAKFLKDRTVGQPCDSEAVSDCVRCKTHFLADRVLYAIQQDMGVDVTVRP